jgi:hypothetical protein
VAGERAIEQTCRECGRPLSFHDGEARAVRCAGCFDGFMQARDIDFLNSYSELGITSRRIVAETCLRALAMESPPHRKVLAMTIMEQYVQAAGDLMALYYALKQRGQQPMMRAMLEFRLDRERAMSFFQEMANTPHTELLGALGLPMPDDIARNWPGLSKRDARDLRLQMVQMLGDVTRMAEMGEGAALAIAQAATEQRGGAALMKQTSWLGDIGLKPNQVATMSIDDRRRTINISAVSVDEKRLTTVVSAIGAMTHVASTLVYATLTKLQEEGPQPAQ